MIADLPGVAGLRLRADARPRLRQQRLPVHVLRPGWSEAPAGRPAHDLARQPAGHAHHDPGQGERALRSETRRATRSIASLPRVQGVHALGTLISDPRDGTLWVGNGDNALPAPNDPHARNAQDVNSLSGKITWIATGTGCPATRSARPTTTSRTTAPRSMRAACATPTASGCGRQTCDQSAGDVGLESRARRWTWSGAGRDQAGPATRGACAPGSRISRCARAYANPAAQGYQGPVYAYARPRPPEEPEDDHRRAGFAPQGGPGRLPGRAARRLLLRRLPVGLHPAAAHHPGGHAGRAATALRHRAEGHRVARAGPGRLAAGGGGLRGAPAGYPRSSTQRAVAGRAAANAAHAYSHPLGEPARSARRPQGARLLEAALPASQQSLPP